MGTITAGRRAADVVVCVAARGAEKAADYALLGGLVAWATGTDRAGVAIDQQCTHCQRSGHGQPVVRSPGAALRPCVGPHVSLSRAGALVALTVTLAGPVGIDIESLDEVSRGGLDDTAFSAAELSDLHRFDRIRRGGRSSLDRSRGDRSTPDGPSADQAGTRAAAAGQPVDPAFARAALWTAKEAVLKATGQGLRIDPRELSVALPGGHAPPVLTAWPNAGFPLDTLHLARFEPGPGLAGTIAVIAPARPRVIVVDASAL